MILRYVPLVVVACSAGVSGPAGGDNLEFDLADLRSRHVVEDLLDISALGTWNGEPVSETNQPSEHHRRLSAVVSIYDHPAEDGRLHVVVSNVVTTQSAWWSGSIFWHTLMTGIRCEIRDEGGLPIALEQVSFEHANVGQNVLDAGGSTPVSNTQGYLWSMQESQLVMETDSGLNHAFAEYGSVTGVVITRGGGVFEVSPAHASVSIDWVNVNVAAEFGQGNQVLEAVPCSAAVTPTFAVSDIGGLYEVPCSMPHDRCAWRPTTTAGWIDLGEDPVIAGEEAVLQMTVAGNPTGQPRIAWISIGDAGLHIEQAANPCPGDLDDDGIVDGADVAMLLDRWGPATDGVGDFDGNGVVNGWDFGAVLGSWGACP